MSFEQNKHEKFQFTEDETGTKIESAKVDAISKQKIPPPVRPRPLTAHGRRRTGNVRDSDVIPSDHRIGSSTSRGNENTLSNVSFSETGTSAGIATAQFSSRNSSAAGASNGRNLKASIQGKQSHTGTFVQRASQEELKVGAEARVLLNMFIREQAENTPMQPIIREMCLVDGHADTSELSDETLSDIAMTLRKIGDDLSQNVELNNVIEKVPMNATRNVFMKVCSQMFLGNNLNWGRVVALFYFAYRLVVRALNTGLEAVAWVQELLSWAVDFIVMYIAKWIISRGGWAMIKEWYVGISNQTWMMLSFIGVAMLLWSFYKKD